MQRIIFGFFIFSSLYSSAQSYQKLHRKSILVDTHNDVISQVVMKGISIEKDQTGRTHTDIGRLKRGGVDVQVFSIFCDERYGKDTAFKYANAQIDSFYAIGGRNPESMMMVRTPDEMKKAIREKKIGCMMGVEGGHMIEDRMDYLDSFYRRGVRYLTLTWNNSTSWASSAWDETRHNAAGDTAFKKGLNEFGRRLVQRMNELGMLVDLSHVGEQTFYDAIQVSTRPVIASHSCVHALCPVPRNLKDDQIRAIGKNGGVIQLNFYSGFVDSNYNKNKNAFLARHAGEVDSLKNLKWANYEIEEWMAKKYKAESEALRPPVSLLLDHLDYIVKMIGIDHVGLGSDFDGIESTPQTLDDVASYPMLTKALLQRGYHKKEIRKILGGNFIRVRRKSMVHRP